MYEIANKVAVITGGTRGIGLAIAGQILALGGKVVVNGRSSTADANTLLKQYGPDRVAIELADVSIPAEATALIEKAAARFKRIDMLVHSAGGPVPGTLVELTTAAWMQAFAVHVHPVFHLFQAAFPYLKMEGGSVLLIASVAALRGCPGSAAYQTVKGALIPLARALAFDNAVHNIRVNVIAPGIIRTRFHDNMTETTKAHNLANRIPLKREGTVEDVGEAALAMLRNEFVTGEVLTVDGGMSMRITG